MTNLQREGKRERKEEGTGKEMLKGGKEVMEVKRYSSMVYGMRKKGCSANINMIQAAS